MDGTARTANEVNGESLLGNETRSLSSTGCARVTQWLNKNLRWKAGGFIRT